MGRLRLPAGFRAVSFFCAGLLACLVFVTGLASQQNTPSGPRIWLQEPRSLPVKYVAAAVGASSGATVAAQNVNDGAAQILASGQGQPLAMIAGDFDRDGVNDLVVGYAVPGGGILAFHRGNLDAFAPQSDASFQAIGRGEFPSPFLPGVQVTRLAIRPDFLAVGNFTGQGDLDLVVAARGGNAIYLFAGDGTGKFANPQIITLTGGITALAAGEFGNGHSLTNLAVGISGPNNSFSFVILGETGVGLGALASYPLSAPASNILFGDFGGGPDAAFISGGHIQILRSSNMQLATVSLPVSASAFALGSFIYDRNSGSQIALLASDGSIQIAVRYEFDPRVYTVEEFSAIRQAKLNHQPPPSFVPAPSFPVNGWRIVEGFPSVANISSSQAPVFFRTRVSSNGADDIMWLSAATGQMAVISHPDVPPGASTFLPGQLSLKPYSGSPVAALPMRINVDGRPGIMALHQGEIAPFMVMPIPDPTFTVNTTLDVLTPGACAAALPGCSLREAIIEANATPGTDTIMVPAGTFSLTRGRAATPLYDAQTGTLNINDSVNIIGAGQNTTIITWGTPVGGPVDMVMAVNEDIPSATVPTTTTATASISSLTIQNGVNHGTHNNDGDGGCMEFDTGTSGTATLSLTNVTIQNCATTQGGGGGLVTFAFVNPAGGGTVTISNSVFQNNSAVDSVAGTEGGGIAISAGSLVTITNTLVQNNTSTNVVSGQAGLGGGIALDACCATPPFWGSTTIHSSTISGNQAAGFGGGVSDIAMGLIVDQGTVISGNKGGLGNVVNAKDGGGVYLSLGAFGCPGSCSFPNTVTFNKVAIINNSTTGNGGGIHTGSGGTFPTAGPMSITFSRLAGNTAGGSGSNLSNSGTTVTATNNWWGTNAAATTINTTIAGATTTFDPFIVLTHDATPAIIKINGTTTLTGDMSQDNHGNGAALSGNLDRIVGLPITFDNPVLGTIPQAQPETLNASAQATATFNAGGASGRGSAHATVDQAVVSANSNLIASASEAVNTVTITTVGAHNFAAGETVVISGVGVGGYDGTFAITATPTATTFTYTDPTPGLGASSGGLANVGIIILEPLQITKSFNPATVAVNAPSALTFSVVNPNVIAVDASFTDTFPANLVVANPPSVTNTCGGTFTPAAGDTSVTFTNASLAVGSCTITVHVQSATDSVYPNSVTINSTAAGTGAQSTSSASLTVINPPTIAKVFGAATIPLNGTTSLIFTFSNTNSNTTLNGIAASDTFPAGLVVATPGNVSTTCNGTGSAPDGASTVSLSGASLAPGASCTVTMNVTGTTAGLKSNTTGNVTATDAGGITGSTASASITVVGPPTISKAFNPTSIALNATSTLSFTITNPNTASALSGVGFTDTLPSGVVVAATPNITGSCGSGTITAVAGSGTISLTGGTLTASPAAGSSCTFSADVTGTTAGSKSNTTGAVTSTEGGTGAPSNTATVTVVAPPTISKAFGAAAIPVNGTTTLNFTITNPAANTVAEAGVAFTDTLPAGLVVATPNGLTNTCGGTATAVAGSGSISLTGGAVAASSTCTVTVNITGTASANYTNTTGAVSSTNGGTGNTASANLAVATPPTIVKSFNPITIFLSQNSTLSFTIQNPNTSVSLTGVAFTDNLPGGLVVASPNGLTGACGGGTITATAGAGTISLSGATLAANASCTFSVNVTGTAASVKNNAVQVTSTEGGAGNTSNASITVNAATPPTISKSFAQSAIGQGSTVLLSITIVNPNSNPNPNVPLTGIAFSDTLPAGLTVNFNTLNTDCGGTLTATPGSISLTGGAIDPGAPPPPSRGRRGDAVTRRVGPKGNAVNAAGFCTVNVNLLVSGSGTLSNTTGAVSANESGTGAVSNTATIDVIQAPTVAKAFGAASIPLNGSTKLTFTVGNPNASTSLVGIAFNDTLPSGLVVASPNGLPNGCADPNANVTGDVVANPGSNTISMTALSLNQSVSCSFFINVTGTTGGTKNNTTGNVTATFDDGSGTFLPVTGGTASASVVVVAPPSIAKSFNPTAIAVNGTSTLTITITNPAANTVAEAGLAFTDTLPASMVVATPNGLTNTCGGTPTATAGFGSVSLTGGTVAAASICKLTVNVTASSTGNFTNTTGAVSSTNGNTGNTATANLTVQPADLTITKTHTGNFSRGQTGATYTITVTNSGQGPTVGTVTVVDNLPNVPNTLVATAMSGTGWTCTLGTLTCTRSDVLAPAGSYPPITLTVNVPLNIQANVTNTATVSGGGETNTGNDTASDQTHIGPPIQITFNVSTLTVSRGNSTSTTFTVDSSAGEGTINFSCSGLPPGASCSFNPPSESQLTATVTLTIATSAGSASAPPFGGEGTTPVYAVLLPLLGLVGIGLGTVKGKKARLRLALCLGGVVFVLATFAGCAGGPRGTPTGAFQITVTATSASTGDSGTATITLNVL
ncbi:MAG TPA: FG-GAP-like repeat-containing protein [Candidatus Acidoferrum sp.]|nr:FG-GAP-like repeat-containing protein [Candidatus Acidoferrum sp.]